MEHIRYKLLKLQNKKVRVKHKKRILKNIEEFLDLKTFGVLLLSEVDKKGNDKVKTLAINCDIIHSREVIKCLLESLPGVKDDLFELEKKNDFSKMVS